MNQISIDISQYYLKNIVVSVKQVSFEQLPKFTFGDLFYYRCKGEYKLMKVDNWTWEDEERTKIKSFTLIYANSRNTNKVVITEDNCTGLYEINE